MLWTAIDEEAGLFAIERIARHGWPLRTTALRLAGGDLALVSPTRGLGDEAHADLARLGRVRWLLAPNHFHHLGLCEHVERYPGAEVVASEAARPRLSRVTGLRVGPLDAIAAHVIVAGSARSGETWLRVPTARGIAWVVSDAFFNLPRAPGGIAVRALMRATGTAPGLRSGGTFRTFALSDRAAYAAWLRGRIERDRPALLVPGHGDAIGGPDLPDRLLALLALARRRLPC